MVERSGQTVLGGLALLVHHVYLVGFEAFISWHGLWGARLGWTGVGMVVASILIYAVVRRG